MAVKDTESAKTQDWTNAFSFRDKLPTGLAILACLSAQPHPTIHPCHSYRIDMQQRRWRMYNDYCDYGCLALALNAYTRMDEAAPLHVLGEGFIWHVFSALVVCEVLQKGAGHAEEGWREIVHKDITLDNVFARDERGVEVKGVRREDAETERKKTFEVTRQGVSCLFLCGGLIGVP